MKSLAAWIGVGGIVLGSTALAAGVSGRIVESARNILARPAALEDAKDDVPARGPKQVQGRLVEELSQQPRSHRVRLSADGLLPGRISVKSSDNGPELPASDLQVWFVSETAEPVQVQVGVDGVFQAAGLQPGVYSLIAAGRSGFLAVGLQVVAAEGALPLAPTPTPTATADAEPIAFQQAEAALEIEVRACPPGDVPTIAELVKTYVNTAASSFDSVIAKADDSHDRVADQPAPANIPSQPATSIIEHLAVLEPDGRFIGRVERLDPRTGALLTLHRMNLFMVRGQSVVGRSPLAENGTFEMLGITPGSYSVVAAGPDGFMAFGADVVASVDPRANQAKNENLFQEVAFADRRIGGNSFLMGVLATGKGASFALQQLLSATGPGGPLGGAVPPGAGAGGPMAGPGGGTTGGGGGGFGGGGGGLGGLLGLAGLAAGAAALANDNNNNDDQPNQPVTPAQP